MELVAPLEALDASDVQRFGHKSVELGTLLRTGFPVPQGFAISGDAFAAQAERLIGRHWWERWRRQLAAAEDDQRQYREIRRRFLEAPLDPALVDQITEAYQRLGTLAPVAVRSSTTAEDSTGSSSAGVQESLLGITDLEGVLEALRRVWASLWGPTARAYLGTCWDESNGPVLVGVVVQRLVEPDAAGVLFTQNPLSGAEDEIVINAAFGLGEPVLSGQLSPDTFVLDKENLMERDRQVTRKPFEVVIEDGRPGRRALDEERASSPSLAPSQLRALGELGQRVERQAGGPRDIEWACVNDEVFLLQSRPITARPQRDDASIQVEERRQGRPTDVWSNANVGEALPGVATPLTWSIAADYSEQGFRRAFGALGCEVPEGAVLVGRFQGRIYLNLSQFVEIAAQVPLLRPQILAELGGARWPEGIEPLSSSFDLRAGARFLCRLPMTAARLVMQQVAVAGQVEGVEARVSEMTRRLDRLDLTTLSGGRLDRELREIDELLEATGDAMLTCGAAALGSFVALRFLVNRWLGDLAPRLEQELLSGASDLESARPGVALWLMAEAIRKDEEAVSILVDSDLSTLRVSSFPEGSRIRRDLDTFQAAYGYRAVREAELTTPRWSEEPSMIFAALREYLRSGGPPPGRAVEARIEARRRAWAQVERNLDPIRRSLVRRLVEMARRYSRLRERLRARVTQVLGLYRTVALEVSRRIGHPDAAFFLTIDEVHRFLKGELSANARRSLGSLIASRRQRYERYRSLPDLPPTFVGQPPEAEAMTTAPGQQLVGLGASGGRATGEARVLTDPRDAGELRAGEILVVPCADVGWSPMFLIAGALVTELGGVLSHAAVVAREYGVPAVFGVSGATRAVVTGQKITVDGDSGRIFL